MANYTKINFEEIDNSLSSEVREMRFARKHLDSTELGMTLMRFSPNFKADKAHSHKVQEEVYVVIKGSGHMLVDGESLELRPYDIIRVAPPGVRAFAAGPDGLEILAAGGQKPAEGDGVMEDANWPS